MRYLTAIRDKQTGETIYRLSYNNGAKYYDAVDNNGDVVPLSKLVGQEIYGCDLKRRRGLVVCMDKKSVMLHKHIVGYKKAPVSTVKCVDAKYILSGGLVMPVSNTDEFGSVLVSTENSLYELQGHDNSVVSCQGLESYVHFPATIYEMLVKLSSKCGVALTRYERIIVSSRFRKSAFEIQLSQSVEAKRFFTKMALEMAK